MFLLLCSERYSNIISRTALLLYELRIVDPYYVSVIFEYLLWNGYFSKDKKMIFDVGKRVNNFSLLGADVMRGYSVCLNNSEMLKDVLNFMGTKAYCVSVNLKDDLGALYRPSIKRNINNSDVSFLDKIREKIFSRSINHAVVLFEDAEYYFGCDPTNLAFLYFTDFLKMKYVGGESEIQIGPLYTLLLNQIDKDEFYKVMINSFILSDEAILKQEDIKMISEKALSLCDENLSLLDDFYLENIEDIDVICKTLRRE